MADLHAAPISDMPQTGEGGASFRLLSPWLPLSLAFLILLLGAYVRLSQLNTHFVHVDDIGVAAFILDPKASVYVEDSVQKILSQEGLTGALVHALNEVGALEPLIRYSLIPSRMTYAPLQYLITPWLLDVGQPYREVLFWGRFPSFVFGVLGIALVAVFHFRTRDEEWQWKALISVTLMSLSWENIIYADQMSNFSFGVLAVVLLVIRLWSDLNASEPSLRRVLVSAAVLAGLSYAHYQIMFLVPAYYLTLLHCHWCNALPKLPLAGRFAASGVLYLLLIAYLFRFLRHMGGSGIHWNAGPSGEFVLDVDATAGLVLAIGRAVTFYCTNGLIVLQSNLAVVPENHTMSGVLATVLTILFGLGLVGFARSASPEKRCLGTFLLLSAFTWASLVLLRKLSLSPTRHSLVLLPLAVLIIAEGAGVVVEKASAAWPGWRRWMAPAVCLGTAALLLISFLACYPDQAQARRDPFNEAELRTVMQRFQVTRIISYDWTWQTAFMTDLLSCCNLFRDPFDYGKAGSLRYDHTRDWGEWAETTGRSGGGSVAFISHRSPLTPTRFEEIKREHRDCLPVCLALEGSLADYQVLYALERPSDVEVEFSARTHNGTNGFFLYVLSGPGL